MLFGDWLKTFTWQEEMDDDVNDYYKLHVHSA